MRTAHPSGRKRRHLSTPRFAATRILTFIIAVGVVALVIPNSWAAWLKNSMAVLLPLQEASSAATHWLSPASSPSASRSSASLPAVATITKQEYQGLINTNERLKHSVAALTERVSALKRQKQILLAMRTRGIGAGGRLIPARIVAQDIAPWRRSAVLNGGTLKGIRQGSVVVSRKFTLDEVTIDRGQQNGVADGMAVLAGEVVVGVIEQAHPLSARVRLLTDPETQMKVRIGRFEDGTRFVLLDNEYWLTGQGGDAMVIRDVVRADADAGRIAVGDSVLAKPAGSFLPVAMTIGTIKEILPDRKNPLLCTLSVTSALPLNAVSQVYVYTADE